MLAMDLLSEQLHKIILYALTNWGSQDERCDQEISKNLEFVAVQNGLWFCEII